jgi:hypothetical protein
MKYYLFVGCGRKCKIKEPRCLGSKNQEAKMPRTKEERQKKYKESNKIQS